VLAFGFLDQYQFLQLQGCIEEGIQWHVWQETAGTQGIRSVHTTQVQGANLVDLGYFVGSVVFPYGLQQYWAPLETPLLCVVGKVHVC
jgi:hypothetical protein